MSGPFLSRLWSEAKRRRVPQVVPTYLGLAWVTIESVPTILRYLGAVEPVAESVGSALTVLWIALFPLALALTWVYQVVPDTGQASDGPLPWHMHRLPVAFVVLLVSGGCAVLAASLWPASPVLANTTARSIDAEAVALLAPRVLHGDSTSRSVADCIVNRVTDRLALLPGVEVRSAMWAHAVGSDLGPEMAAARLGVGRIITASVEDFGDSLRLSFQIVDGPSGAEVAAFSIVEPVPATDGTFERLAEAAEHGLRSRLGAVDPSWLERASSADPEVVAQEQTAADEEAAYRQNLEAGDVDGALTALERLDASLARWIRLAPGEPDPAARRSWTARQQALLLLTNDRPRAVLELERALRFADEAVRRHPTDGESLRMRAGAAIELARTDLDAGRDRPSLFRQAELDLRWAQAHHRNRAMIRRELALLKQVQGALPEAYGFAADAYAHDSWFTLSDVLLSDLFELAFDLGRDEEAVRWCEEGATRFTGRWAFAAECRLRLMGWGGLPSDTAAGRALASEVLAAYPPSFRGVLRPQVETLLAAVHVQAGDSALARNILTLSTLGTSPAVRLTAAGVWLLLGDEQEAISELSRYVTELPTEAERLARLRILAPLRGDPRFAALLRLRPD